MDGYKHYIRVNENGVIVHGFTDAFESPEPGDICILDNGPRHFHLVHPWPLINERGQYRYRWDILEGITERSEEELDAEWASMPKPETQEDRIAKLEAELAVAREERLAAMEAIAELYETIVGGGMS